jgi:hypothetical protein
MKRRLFNILTVLSLVLCVVTMVLGILSLWVVMLWGYCGNGGGPYVEVSSSRGCIDVEYEPAYAGSGSPWTGFYAFPADDFSNSLRWNHLGFDMHTIEPSAYGPEFAIEEFYIPEWFICSVTAIPPFLWYRSYRLRRLRKLKGLCLQCGYDLRASKERCPECGTAFSAQEAKA